MRYDADRRRPLMRIVGSVVGHPAGCLPVGGNTHDSMLLEAVVDAVPPIKGSACGRLAR
jgi:hypothetical protein